MMIAFQVPESLQSWISEARLQQAIGAGLVLLIGFPVVALVARLIYRVTAVRFSVPSGVMIARVVRWFLVALVVATALNQFGINLGAALGAAGVAGIAIGLAAQTSLSNVISGFFLLAEKSFIVGDLIDVDGVTGTVDSIGMISATVRTPDNRSVRIPNETLVKSKVTNVTRNPIRRYDLNVGVSYEEDIGNVMRVLRETADNHPLCLDEPAPLVLFVGFGASSIDFLLGVWLVKEDYMEVRNTIAHQVQLAFKREGIEIPFPHQVLAAGKAAAPISIRLIKDEPGDKGLESAE